MRKPIKYGIIAGASLLGFGLAWGLYLLVLAGELSGVEPTSGHSCVRIEGVVGGEDLVRSRAGMLLVSSEDRRAPARGESVRGAILVVDPEGTVAPYDASEGTLEQLHPHGLSLWTGADGHERLFVVNHPHAPLFGAHDDSGGPLHTIEIFDVLSEGERLHLEHRQTIANEALISPNDVAAVDDTRFYVTNDHGAAGGLAVKLEEYGHLARGSVLYWDGQAFTRVAEGIHYANGVALSPDGRALYVASVTGGKVLVFEREPSSGALSLRETVDARGPDNITVAEDGSLWIGAHPKLLTFTAYSKDPTKLSPSMVTRLSPGPEGWTRSDLFVSEGRDISGSTVALPLGEGRFVIGSVLDGWLLDCRAAP